MAFDPKGKQTFYIKTPALQVRDHAAESHTVFYAARLLEGVLGVAVPGLRPEADPWPPARETLPAPSLTTVTAVHPHVAVSFWALPRPEGAAELKDTAVLPDVRGGRRPDADLVPSNYFLQ